MFQRDYHDHILGLEVLVQRYVARPPAGDHKLPKRILDATSDHRMALQNGNTVKNEIHNRIRGARILGGQEFVQSVEIGFCACGKN